MCADRQIGAVGGWRYFIRERNGDGVYTVMRRDAPEDRLEYEIAFSYSYEIAEVIAVAIVAHERRKKWAEGESIRT